VFPLIQIQGGRYAESRGSGGIDSETMAELQGKYFGVSFWMESKFRLWREDVDGLDIELDTSFLRGMKFTRRVLLAGNCSTVNDHVNTHYGGLQSIVNIFLCAVH
jgi:hypothetical protein